MNKLTSLWIGYRNFFYKYNKTLSNNKKLFIMPNVNDVVYQKPVIELEIEQDCWIELLLN